MKLSYLGYIFLAVIVLSSADVVNAATLNINTSKDTFLIDDQFNADIKIDSQDAGVNAAQATIKFSPAILEAVSVDKTGSAFNFWIQDPKFDNNTGEITFIGGASSGLIGKSLQAVRIVFKAKGLGQTDLVFTDGAVTASDGSGTNVLSAMNKTSITVANASLTTTGAPQVKTIERTPITSDTNPGKPAVKVPLYPDPTRWYNVSSKFSANWQLPNDISAVAVELNKDPAFNPSKSAGIFDNETFSALTDGVWYLHVRFYNNIGGSEVTHYRIAVDTVTPSPFEIKFSDGLTSNNPAPVITYQANDQLSGIDHYYIQIDQNEAVNTTLRSYTLPPQKPGKHTIKVGAQDKAGNKVENTAQYEILPIESPTISSVSTIVFVGEGGLLISGKSLANAVMVLEIRDQKSNIIYSLKTNSDKSGSWAMRIDSPLKKGNYNIFATAQDSRGAMSVPVKSDLINVQERPILLFWGLSITSSQLIILLLIILAGGYIIGWYSNKLINSKRERRILISQRDVASSFNLIKKDIEKSLRSWDDKKIEESELTQMEFLLNRINENLERLQKYIISGIKDIGKK